MPRLDGRLYEWEKAAVKKEAEAASGVVKVKKKMGRPPKPKPIEAPPPPAPPRVTLAQGLAKIASEMDIKTVPVARNGKPLKATKELIESIRASVRQGLSIDKSCILHGVTSAALDKWKKANADIMEGFRQAELEGETELVKIIRDAAPKDWKAANWLLERRHEWEQRSRTELTGKDGGPIMSVSQQLLASVASGASPAEKAKARKPRAIDVESTVKE